MLSSHSSSSLSRSKPRRPSINTVTLHYLKPGLNEPAPLSQYSPLPAQSNAVYVPSDVSVSDPSLNRNSDLERCTVQPPATLAQRVGAAFHLLPRPTETESESQSWLFRASRAALSSVDAAGERLAYWFGITTPKYQEYIDEAHRQAEERRQEENDHFDGNRLQWLVNQQALATGHWRSA